MADTENVISHTVVNELNIDHHQISFENISSEEIDYSSTPPSYDIATYPADFTLEVLHHKWRKGEIVVPNFQRQFVWSRKQSSKLIESFLVRLPVPPIYLYNEKDSHKYLVIDGQQRLKSIFFYFDGYINDDQDIFSLDSLNAKSPFFGLAFDNLAEDDRLKLQNSVLRAFIVRQLDSDDSTSIFHIFERLNSGGTFLTNQEIRNSVFHSKFSTLLSTMNESQNWRKIVGQNSVDRRCMDIELILRFLAMRDISDYKKPMKDYLTTFMARNKDVDEKLLQSYNDTFIITCHNVLNSLGPRPFHLESGLNTAVFDSVMSCFSNNINAIPEDIGIRFQNLIENKEFDKYIRTSTTDEYVIKERFKFARSFLFDD